MSSDSVDLQTKVVRYYEDKLHEHGATPAGVDWNSEASQRLRFEQLCRDVKTGLSVLDAGCGYGGLLDHLGHAGWSGDYVGFDLSTAMVDAARDLHPHHGRFITELPEPASADVVVASGLFNVKLDIDDDSWIDYVDTTIVELFERCRVGLAFNMLTSYSDAERMQPRLHYGRPARYFDFVAQNCSRRVTLQHDYGLYEFTILVRR